MILGGLCAERYEKLSEGEFWERYFQSKLHIMHQASIRSTATQHVSKADPVFDKYLEKPDDGKHTHTPYRAYMHLIVGCIELEPRRQMDEEVEMFVNLGATNEDHDQVRLLLFFSLTRHEEK